MKGDYGAMMVWQEIGRGPFEQGRREPTRAPGLDIITGPLSYCQNTVNSGYIAMSVTIKFRIKSKHLLHRGNHTMSREKTLHGR